MHQYSRFRDGFTRAQIAALAALADGPRTAEQIAAGRIEGPITITLRWLVGAGYATPNGPDIPGRGRTRPVYTLTEAGHAAHQRLTNPPPPEPAPEASPDPAPRPQRAPTGRGPLSRAKLESLGRRLRALRVGTGMNGRDFAARMGWTHASVVSRLEHGDSVPTAQHLRAWCRTAGATGVLPDLLEEARALRAHIKAERAAIHRDQGYEMLGDTVMRSRRFWTISTATIAPLYATEDYAAVLARLDADFFGPAPVPRHFAKPYRPRSHHQVRTLITESALYSCIGGPDTMRDQLTHLYDEISSGTEGLAILPYNAILPPFPGNLLILDDAVILDTLTGPHVFASAIDVALYTDHAVRAHAAAATGVDAQTIVHNALGHVAVAERTFAPLAAQTDYGDDARAGPRVVDPHCTD